jgi:hypothetical protein
MLLRSARVAHERRVDDGLGANEDLDRLGDAEGGLARGHRIGHARRHAAGEPQAMGQPLHVFSFVRLVLYVPGSSKVSAFSIDRLLLVSSP